MTDKQYEVFGVVDNIPDNPSLCEQANEISQYLKDIKHLSGDQVILPMKFFETCRVRTMSNTIRRR